MALRIPMLCSVLVAGCTDRTVSPGDEADSGSHAESSGQTSTAADSSTTAECPPDAHICPPTFGYCAVEGPEPVTCADICAQADEGECVDHGCEGETLVGWPGPLDPCLSGPEGGSTPIPASCTDVIPFGASVSFVRCCCDFGV